LCQLPAHPLQCGVFLGPGSLRTSPQLIFFFNLDPAYSGGVFGTQQFCPWDPLAAPKVFYLPLTNTFFFFFFPVIFFVPFHNPDLAIIPPPCNVLPVFFSRFKSGVSHTGGLRSNNSRQGLPGVACFFHLGLKIFGRTSPPPCAIPLSKPFRTRCSTACTCVFLEKKTGFFTPSSPPPFGAGTRMATPCTFANKLFVFQNFTLSIIKLTLGVGDYYFWIHPKRVGG